MIVQKSSSNPDLRARSEVPKNPPAQNLNSEELKSPATQRSPDELIDPEKLDQLDQLEQQMQSLLKDIHVHSPVGHLKSLRKLGVKLCKFGRLEKFQLLLDACDAKPEWKAELVKSCLLLRTYLNTVKGLPEFLAKLTDQTWKKAADEAAKAAGPKQFERLLSMVDNLTKVRPAWALHLKRELEYKKDPYVPDEVEVKLIQSLEEFQKTEGPYKDLSGECQAVLAQLSTSRPNAYTLFRVFTATRSFRPDGVPHEVCNVIKSKLVHTGGRLFLELWDKIVKNNTRPGSPNGNAFRDLLMLACAADEKRRERLKEVGDLYLKRFLKKAFQYDYFSNEVHMEDLKLLGKSENEICAEIVREALEFEAKNEFEVLMEFRAQLERAGLKDMGGQFTSVLFMAMILWPGVKDSVQYKTWLAQLKFDDDVVRTLSKKFRDMLEKKGIKLRDIKSVMCAVSELTTERSAEKVLQLATELADDLAKDTNPDDALATLALHHKSVQVVLLRSLFVKKE